MNDKYIPLYRKYRPQKLEEIVGQEHIKKALANAIAMNKISHAYLFTGPRGTGKTSTARIFAKSLNCIEGPTISPCGVCENCIDITNSVPMDVIEIDAASNRKVEDAQNILEKVMYAPVNSRYKIYIIDEVHMLSNTAFNALLKTLEEPPENVIFILATTEVHKVLDTIKSRCQRFDFRRITTDDIVKHLRYISDKEGINITDDALFTIAKNSAGGMRDSIALLDQLSILDSGNAISTEDINALLGRISFDTLKALSDAIVKSNPQEAITVLENIYNSGNEPTQILTNLLDYFKNMLIVKNCSQDIVFELTQLNEAQIKELSEQVKDLETHQLTFLIDKTSNYIKEVKTTNNPRLWLEVGVIDLANLADNTKLIDLQNRIIALESGASPSVSTRNFSTAPAPISAVRKIKEQFLEQAKMTPEKMPEPKPDSPTLSETVPATPVQPPVQPQANSTAPKSVVNAQTVSDDEFSPMPVAKAPSGDDIASLWGQLLENISSAPTRALLKQWANPIKISPEETVITIKNDVLLNQFVSGNKKTMLTNAVNLLFSQENSNIIVRLPQPGDTVIQPIVAKPRKMVKASGPTPIPQEAPDEQEITEAVEAKKIEVAQSPSDKKDSGANKSFHSDQVNMVIDLFDGKIIE